MIERKASVLVCDEILFAMTGKVYMHGLYQSDITIAAAEQIVGQLVFYFMIETPTERPLQKFALKVLLPGMPEARVEGQIPAATMAVSPLRKKLILRQPFMLQQVVLRPGKIETTVITEKEELDAGGIWITSAQLASQPET